jgi:hypothetical protein
MKKKKGSGLEGWNAKTWHTASLAEAGRQGNHVAMSLRLERAHNARSGSSWSFDMCLPSPTCTYRDPLRYRLAASLCPVCRSALA